MIEFGDWQVRRADALNLTLYHRHAATRGKSVGEVGWHATGNFFKSVEDAVMFALMADARAEVGDDSRMEMAEYVRSINKLIDDCKEWLSEAIKSS